jgi:chemotaxis protein methyltransferase WspC
MSLITIERLLEEKIGLSVDIVGSETVALAIRRRMNDCGIGDSVDYLVYLNTSDKEWDELVEAVIVPETWFFRNEESFAFLGWYVRSEWLPKHQHDILRVLSVPCSTGEEPYSIAITLMNIGLLPDRFSLDAMDISSKGLYKARLGLYGPESFRKQNTFQSLERYFTATPNGYQIDPSIRKSVHFMRGNLLDNNVLVDKEPYDVIFCRNLLIYLSPTAKQQVIQALDRLLAKTGILFVGHAERPAFNGSKFVWVRRTGVFACQRVEVSQKSQVQVQPQVFHKPDSLRQNPPVVSPYSYARGVQVSAVSPKNATVGRDLHSVKDREQLSGERIDLFDKARQLADQGDLEEALRLCKQYLSQNPTNVQCHFLTGLLYQASGDIKTAEEYLNRVIYLDPNHQEALSYMAFIAERRGDRDKAALLRQRMDRIQRKLQVNSEQ